MSHELQYLDTNSDYGWGESISLSDYNYFYVPSIPEWAYSEFDGLLYEGVQYNWAEVDYRLTVEYNAVPEPADLGLLMGLAFAGFIAYKIISKKNKNLKCALCKFTDSIISKAKALYTKIITK